MWLGLDTVIHQTAETKVYLHDPVDKEEVATAVEWPLKLLRPVQT